jgi:S1-C subfamily serine protease
MEENKHALWFALLVVVALSTYGLYSETRKDLETAQEQIDKLINENDNTIASQQELIDQKEEELEEVKASEVDLQDALDELQTVSSSGGSNIASSLVISKFAPSVVRLVCLTDATTRGLQQGSGILFKSDSHSLAPYYIQTNLHVIETDDGSPSQCVIAVHPDADNSSEYIVYQSSGYSLYKSGVDLAYIKPREVSNHSKAGRLEELDLYGQDDSKTSICNSASIGDHLSVLGYPKIGGDTLTATDGIISGFEFRDGIRYIKTSAKIDQGNSGGVAISDTGCVYGIPTYVQAQIESLGRILDLKKLING